MAGSPRGRQGVPKSLQRKRPVLAVRELSKAYPGKVVLDRVSFELQQQHIYALMGANGAGKTTLFNILSGFVRSDGGAILLNGQPVAHLHPHERARSGISRSFQDLPLITTMSVRENLVLASRQDPTTELPKALLAPCFARATRGLGSSVESLLIEYSLKDWADYPAGDLSYGQQKLLTLACAAANGGSSVLLDEPVASVSTEHVHRNTMSLRRMRSQR